MVGELGGMGKLPAAKPWKLSGSWGGSSPHSWRTVGNSDQEGLEFCPTDKLPKVWSVERLGGPARQTPDSHGLYARGP